MPAAAVFAPRGTVAEGAAVPATGQGAAALLALGVRAAQQGRGLEHGERLRAAAAVHPGAVFGLDAKHLGRDGQHQAAVGRHMIGAATCQSG